MDIKELEERLAWRLDGDTEMGTDPVCGLLILHEHEKLLDLVTQLGHASDPIKASGAYLFIFGASVMTGLQTYCKLKNYTPEQCEAQKQKFIHFLSSTFDHIMELRKKDVTEEAEVEEVTSE